VVKEMKILYFTDPHNSDAPPRMRMPSYTEDILAKQEALIEPAKKCDIVICGGDVFHQKKAERVSHGLVNRVMEIYREFPSLYICVGNHDIDTQMAWEDRPLGTLTKLPNIQVFHSDVVRMVDVDVAFWGGGEFYDWKEFDGFINNYVKGSEPGMIGVFHSSIANAVYDYETRTVTSLEKYNFDYILLGHLHDYQACTDHIVAPGGLSRGVLKYDLSLTRKIYYSIIELGKKPKMIEIPHKSIDEIFRLDEKGAEVDRQAMVNSFVEFVQNMKAPRGVTREQLIASIKKMDIDEKVQENAIRILEAV